MSILKFTPNAMEPFEDFLATFPELGSLDAGQLESLKQQAQEMIQQLDTLEPKNQNSETYDSWATLHEDMEDALDDILDALN